jgi:hypothetical protein
MCCMRKYHDCDCLEILTVLHIFNPLESERVTFQMLSVCIYVYICMDVCLANARRVGGILFVCGVFGSLSIYHLNMNILAQNI